jgi:two-component system chemotaxis response regulator CheY
MTIATVSAAEDLCLRTIETFYADVHAAVQDGGSVRLDLSAVTAPDLSIVQLVEVARRHAATTGGTLALAKPANPALKALLHRAGFLSAATPADIDFWFHVDDSASLRMAIRIALTGAGYAVTEAGDGVEGLAKAGAAQFDLIVTDLNMPNMDGLTMIRELRKQPAQAGVPIIFLTTESDADMKAQAKEAGATGWLVKPFVPEQLVKVARKVLGR